MLEKSGTVTQRFVVFNVQKKFPSYIELLTQHDFLLLLQLKKVPIPIFQYRRIKIRMSFDEECLILYEHSLVNQITIYKY